ncbi:hypothetical protein GC096_22565 [Paenibacillus sp. LMG 31461]|uniref:Uncharacterized protein n=1 Tax=Paenibacillus plantarum TaxID=2654975 RepID=A0ABX1XED4_9BACL|nr:hypothetical protein [Paenibacillus plantarum]NOU66835.1 hypothetical protein [Paenibacillus plantarum]
MSTNNKNYLLYFIGAVGIAVLLQFISIGLLGNSVASNIPLLGELLTVIDFLYLTHYLNHGLDLNNMEQFLLRAVSLAATAYTAIKMFDWGFYRLNELFNDSPDFAPIVKGLTIVVAIIIHFFIYFALHTIYIDTLYQLFHRVQVELDTVQKLIQNLQ